jgi:tRNA A-37 threonylcarbamoyl transferase component Bud32
LLYNRVKCLLGLDVGYKFATTLKHGMADLSITVNYRASRAPYAWAGTLLVCVLWYALGVLAVALNWDWLTHSHSLLAKMFIPFLAAMYCYFPFVLIASRMKECNLLMSAAGMLIPSRLGTLRRRQVEWNELRSVDIDKAQRLLLTMSNGSKIKLDTKRLSVGEQVKVLLAIEMFSPNSLWTERSQQFKEDIQDNHIDATALTFTKMWDEELRRHYQSTTFVPHEPGTKLRSGSLTVVRQLAFGGFSAVYLVEDSELNRQFVLKEHVIRSSDTQAEEKARQMFQREATILAALNNDSIARVFDHFTEQDHSYLLMEYVSGENLRKLVRQSGPVTEERVIALAFDMLNIIDYLHHQNPPIIHRDFTPDNLILSPSGKLTLIDFGSANEYVAQATGTLVGKQSYMPLEQIRGKTEPRSDLYALGCTLYFLVTGKDPEPLTVSQPELQNEATSSMLNQVIMRLTQADAEDRYSDCETVRDALQTFKLSVKDQLPA